MCIAHERLVYSLLSVTDENSIVCYERPYDGAAVDSEMDRGAIEFLSEKVDPSATTLVADCNCRDVIATKYSLAVGSAIMAESSLAFLGLGDPLRPSWGGIINEAYSYGALSLGLWWWYTVPAMLISVLVVSFMFIGQSKNEDRRIG